MNTIVFRILTICLFLLPIESAEKNSCSTLSAYHFLLLSPKCYYNPDVLSSVSDMVTRHGYNFETFSVTTDDGYILSVFRVNSKHVASSKGPVFIQHGIFTNSAVWVDTGNRSLAFILADRGYDVWLGNVRGSTYSKKHTRLTVNDPSYWNFNLDTTAKYDLGSQLNFVYNKTGKSSIYIGHSLGTTIFFMFASEFSEMSEKLVKGAILLAPIAYTDGLLFFTLIAPLALPLIELSTRLNRKGLLYQDEIIHPLVVRYSLTFPELFLQMTNFYIGESKQLKSDDLPLLSSSTPCGSSSDNIKQFYQIRESKKFQHFDYGSVKNLKVYGSEVPPVYNLSRILQPIALFYGENDNFYKRENVERLYNEIGTSRKYKYSIKANNFGYNHLDFEYPNSVTDEESLYPTLFKVLDFNAFKN